MNKNTFYKRIHQALRENGYERRSMYLVVGIRVYETFTVQDGMAVRVPGNWSIPLRTSIVNDLMETLKEFNPTEANGVIGVNIYFPAP